MTSLDATPVTDQTQGEAPGGVRAVVAGVRRRLAWFGGARRVLGVLACGLLLLATLVVLDALWPMGARTRGVIGWALLGLFIVGLGWSVWPRRRPHGADLSGASRIEAQLALRDQPLLTAMTLHDSAAPDPLADALQERARQRADEHARQTTARRVAPLSLLRRPAGWLWLALALWLVMVLLFPSLPGAGLARLATPGADVPPFSLTTFDVAWSPAPPTVGDDVRVVAAADGLTPDAVTLVLLDASNRPVARRPMVLADDGWALVLRGLREPVTFHLEAHGRRTHRYTITPEPPTPEDAPGEDNGQGDDTEAGAPGDESRDGAADAGDGAGGGEASSLPDVLGELAGLAGTLSDLASQAERAAGGEGGVSPEKLAEQLDQLVQDAEALADALEGMAEGMPAAQAQALQELAEALRGLAVSGLPSDGSAEGDPTPADTAQQMRDAADAARQDAAELAQGLGEAMDAFDSGRSNRGGEETPQNPDPAAAGRYHELLGTGEDGVLPDALMQQVPPRYREQTADYFRRLAEPRPAPDEDTP